MGAVLFKIFLCDLDNTSSNVSKFVDDTKVYRVVDNRLGSTQLQNDLDVDWAVKRQMNFSVDKCKFVHCGKRSTEFEYSLYGHPPEAVPSKKNLGVVFSNDLNVRRQCEEAYSKASQMLGLINRTFKNPIIYNK